MNMNLLVFFFHYHHHHKNHVRWQSVSHWNGSVNEYESECVRMRVWMFVCFIQLIDCLGDMKALMVVAMTVICVSELDEYIYFYVWELIYVLHGNVVLCDSPMKMISVQGNPKKALKQKLFTSILVPNTWE